MLEMQILYLGGNKFIRCRIRCNHSTKSGHGANAVEELGGHYVMMNTDFTDESSNSGDFTTQNDFRRLIIIRPNNRWFIASATTLRVQSS